MFSNIVFTSSDQIVRMKKKYIWNTKYTIQHSMKRSQTIKCIQCNPHDTKSYELPNCK